MEKICKPMKIVEVWSTLTIKKYVCVCSNSTAFARLLQHLESPPGLLTMRTAAKSNVLLHDPSGIPECKLLVDEFGRCAAGGLPPPAHLPTATEEEKRKATAEERYREEAAAEARQLANEEAATMESDMLALTTPSGSASSRASEQQQDKADGSKHVVASESLADNMDRVHFSPTQASLVEVAGPTLRGCSRAFVVLDIASTAQAVCVTFAETAVKLWKE